MERLSHNSIIKAMVRLFYLSFYNEFLVLSGRIHYIVRLECILILMKKNHLQRVLMTRPGFQYAEGGWAIMDTSSSSLFQNSTPLDYYYQQHSNELPLHIQSACITRGTQSNQGTRGKRD